ncbi:MAG: hypothetical protein K0B06_11875, partial [Brevefilum sp.]|nr:hypothetical protein [Brevefilum sp.]
MKKNVIHIFSCIILIGMALQYSPIQASSISFQQLVGVPRIESEFNSPELKTKPDREFTQWHPEPPTETRYPHEDLSVEAEAQVYTPPTAEQLVFTEAQVRSFDCSMVTDVPDIECKALVALYESTNGSGWNNNTNWLENNDPKTWYGVTVESRHVTKLILQMNGLSGQVPVELADLSNLETLYFWGSGLSGPIDR